MSTNSKSVTTNDTERAAYHHVVESPSIEDEASPLVQSSPRMEEYDRSQQPSERSSPRLRAKGGRHTLASWNGRVAAFPPHADSNIQPQRRSWKRRVFVFMTEPESSTGATIFYAVLILTIGLSNLITVMQTMEQWQYSPTDCVTCGGYVQR